MEEKNDNMVEGHAEKMEEGGNIQEEKNLEKNEVEHAECKKKIKNYLSAIILLAGLLVGSVFVDVAQFFSAQGFSPRALKTADVVSFNGKTWVAYNEPIVSVDVITDDTCEKCDPTEPLKWMKRIIPTMTATKMDPNSAEGKDLVERFNIKSIPAFVFNQEIEKTDVFTQAQSLFAKQDSKYLIDTEQIGIKAGKFLETPSIGEDDAQEGPEDSEVRVVLFSDFQCPYCKAFFETFRKTMSENKGRAIFAYKHVPLDFHAQAMNAAMASECAKEQGKFWEMADKLYASVDDWGQTEGAARFKTYAVQLGLSSAQFGKCMDESKYKDLIAKNQEEAKQFNISGTPAAFVNDNFFGGLVSYEDFSKAIKDEIEK